MTTKTAIQPEWRHKKRGNTYFEIGRGILQTSYPELDEESVIIYQAEHGGQIYVRPVDEFMDGRFERVQ